jgi:hypothetical protein
MAYNYMERLAKSYEFENVNGYFNYIVESLYNGHRQQVISLYNKMDMEGKEEFLNYLTELEEPKEKEILRLLALR